MDLPTVWFVAIAVLWTGYLVLEGFDFGVGMLLPVLDRRDRRGASRLVAGAPRTSASVGESETRRRTLLTTIGPHWDG
ncbi:MAG: cytochrome d ubiquinol oxidase subunit II, partial [Pseudonocardia sp.]|nr:cytochrome d ubiquinol oxidase subunit II [Pseudonocardia sp.]